MCSAVVTYPPPYLAAPMHWTHWHQRQQWYRVRFCGLRHNLAMAKWLQLVYPEDTGSAAEGTWPSKQALHHDQELNTVADAFKTEPYNLFTNNCHVFVSAVMTHVDYRNTHWDPFKVAVLVFFCARYTSLWGFLHT
ncbi:uncharacterized protein HaLaN_26471, partial [Haematococcus lacustris]